VFAPLFALTFSLATVDWLMSLDPRWFSTLYAVYTFAGLLQLALALVTLATVLLRERGLLADVADGDRLHDLGKLLFAFSCFWAYLWLCQYLLVWYGDLPEEVGHYEERTRGPWLAPFLLNPVLNWIVPFVALLTREAKRRPRTLKRVCVLLLVGRWLDLYLAIAPELWGAPRLGALEVGVAAGYAGLLLLLTMRGLARAPLVPRADPCLEEGSAPRP
jgi:hypothetical protein